MTQKWPKHHDHWTIFKSWGCLLDISEQKVTLSLSRRCFFNFSCHSTEQESYLWLENDARQCSEARSTQNHQCFQFGMDAWANKVKLTAFFRNSSSVDIFRSQNLDITGYRESVRILLIDLLLKSKLWLSLVQYTYVYRNSIQAEWK